MLSAMEAGTLPPSLCDAQTPALADTPFTLVTEPTRWAAAVKTAAVSNFGFGGNNAHLIVQNYVPPSSNRRQRRPHGTTATSSSAVWGAVTGDTADIDEFPQARTRSRSRTDRARQMRLELAGLGFPPSELRAASPSRPRSLPPRRRCTGSAPNVIAPASSSAWAAMR